MGICIIEPCSTSIVKYIILILITAQLWDYRANKLNISRLIIFTPKQRKLIDEIPYDNDDNDDDDYKNENNP